MEELYTKDKKGILGTDSKIPKFQILTLGTCQIVPFWNDLTCPQCSKMKQKGQTYWEDLICIWYKRKEEWTLESIFIQYPKCSTCKKAKQWLEKNNISFQDRNIVLETPTEKELETWIQKSGYEIKKFFNTSRTKI